MDDSDAGNGGNAGVGVIMSGVEWVINGQLDSGSTSSSDARLGNNVLIFLPTDGANGADFDWVSVFSICSLWKQKKRLIEINKTRYIMLNWKFFKDAGEYNSFPYPIRRKIKRN